MLSLPHFIVPLQHLVLGDHFSPHDGKLGFFLPDGNFLAFNFAAFSRQRLPPGDRQAVLTHVGRLWTDRMVVRISVFS